MNRWVTSDMHFGHGNVIRFENRPYKDVYQMNDKLIDNWNSVVGANDIVYHIGDFCFRSKGCVNKDGISFSYADYLSRLNGNIILIEGNHDKRNNVKVACECLDLTYHGRSIHMCHSPVDSNPHSDLNLVGHVHSKWKLLNYNGVKIINVGTDIWGYKPVSLNTIIKLYNTTNWNKINKEGTK